MAAVTTGRNLDRFLSNLSALVESLPSPDAKAQMDRELQSLIQFLQDFRIKLKSLPTCEDADQVALTVEAVKDCIRMAEADPAISHVLGLSSQSGFGGRSKRRPATAGDREASRKAAEELRKMPPLDVERLLAKRGKYNVPALRQIGAELGLRIPSKATRMSIVDKITKSIANGQGYEYLSRGAVGRTAISSARSETYAQGARE